MGGQGGICFFDLQVTWDAFSDRFHLLALLGPLAHHAARLVPRWFSQHLLWMTQDKKKAVKSNWHFWHLYWLVMPEWFLHDLLRVLIIMRCCDMLFLIFSFHESQEGHLLIFCFIYFICLKYVSVVCFRDVVTGKGTIYTVRCKLVLAAGSSTGGCSDQALLLGALLWEIP